MSTIYPNQLFLMSRYGFLPLLSLLMFALTNSRAASPDENWDDRFAGPGVNNGVHAIATIGTDVYVGGRFTQAGGSNMNYVARWDGRSWSSLGAGISNLVSYNDLVFALATATTNLYVGGSFRVVGAGLNSSLIARWDGSDWSALGVGITDSDINAAVNAIAVQGNNVYAGGTFKAYGAMTATNIARWDGVAWSNMGGGVNGTVNALVVDGNNLYVGGLFTITGVAANLAKWDGNSWSSVGGGVNGSVLSLGILNGDLYVRGAFNLVGNSVATDGFAKWNGSNWSTPHAGMVTNPVAMGVAEGFVYLGGTAAGSNPARSRFARWDGLNWSVIGNDGDFGSQLIFYALTVSGGSVYLGGDTPLNTTDLIPNNILKWEGGRWESLGQGLEFAANALLVSGSNVYAGGSLTRVGGRAANKVARWDGSRWYPLGAGVSGVGASVTALAGNDTNLFAAGSFDTAGGAPANRLARWDGNNWWPLGTGISVGTPRALALVGSNLYVGGNFTSVGSVNATNVARWDGSNWWPLGAGVNNTVYALATDGNNLYVGGVFSRAGAVNTTCVARWDGANWSGYGSDFFSSTVNAMAVSGTNLYIAGGLFNIAVPNLNNVARWNGSSWSALGSGVAGAALALAVRGNEVWVSGQFTSASTVPANRVAKWNGSNWSALGSGMGTVPSSSYATALALLGNDLYATGGLEVAGGKRSRFFGIWHEPRPSLDIVQVPGVGFVITWNSELNQTYQVYSTGDLSQPFTPLSGLLTSTGTTTTYTNLAPNATAQFYQVQQVFP